MKDNNEFILVADFGSQYTQLILRKIREHNVYCKMAQPENMLDVIRNENKTIKGIVFSGGPSSSLVCKGDVELVRTVLSYEIPVIGICYGAQLIANAIGGTVSSTSNREYGSCNIKLEDGIKLNICMQTVSDALSNSIVWMSHGDTITELPASWEKKDVKIIARTENKSIACFIVGENIIGFQFHPEVSHTQNGVAILSNFLDIAKNKPEKSNVA